MATVVIGAGGYTAFNLVKEISKTEEVLAVLSETNVATRKFYTENNIKMLPSIEFLLQQKLNKGSKIIYLGGTGGSDHTFTDIDKLTRAYITGVAQSLEVARTFGLPILISGSYWELILDPMTNTSINLYASFQSAQNKILEYFAFAYNTSITKVFLADVYGPHDPRPKLLQFLINSVEFNKELKMGNPNQIIAPIFINDVVDDLINIMSSMPLNKNSVGKIQILPREIYTIKEFVSKFEDISARKVRTKWNSIKKIRMDIENFPVIKDIYKTTSSYTSLDDGLHHILYPNNHK